MGSISSANTPAMRGNGLAPRGTSPTIRRMADGRYSPAPAALGYGSSVSAAASAGP
jgi:hypothetical protein